MIKKGEIITILAVLLSLYITDSAKAEINDVEITPDEPTTEDIITVVTFGTETSGPVAVIDSFVNITDTEIGLDLTLVVGPFAVITPWSYSQDIGILPAGTYDLTVRIIVDSVVTDTYFKTFQIVPEHAMTLDGSGTEEDPWLIQSLEDFNDFAADPNYWAGFTRLETDVNLAGQTYSTAVIATPLTAAFTGVFDGNNHTISNFTYTSTGTNCIGLFGDVFHGEIKDIGLIDPNLDAGTGDYVGSLVGGQTLGTITNCYVEGGSVAGGMYVGGLVGWSGGDVSNCYSTGNVNGDIYVGGLVGENISFFGSIWSISNSYSTGDVNGDTYVGGLVGENIDGSISNSYSTGDVNGVSDVGGLVGYNYLGIISNCYSSGDVYGDWVVGGLVGRNMGEGVSNCYSTGDVSDVFAVGGLVGLNQSGGTITNCFWDIETSGEPNMCGNENPTCDNSYGKTTAEMQTMSTFTDANWDFLNVWNIGENQTYPYLRTYLPSDINKDGIVNFLDLSITANQWMQVQ